MRNAQALISSTSEEVRLCYRASSHLIQSSHKDHYACHANVISCGEFRCLSTHIVRVIKLHSPILRVRRRLRSAFTSAERLVSLEQRSVFGSFHTSLRFSALGGIPGRIKY